MKMSGATGSASAKPRKSTGSSFRRFVAASDARHHHRSTEVFGLADEAAECNQSASGLRVAEPGQNR